MAKGDDKRTSDIVNVVDDVKKSVWGCFRKSFWDCFRKKETITEEKLYDVYKSACKELREYDDLVDKKNKNKEDREKLIELAKKDTYYRLRRRQLNSSHFRNLLSGEEAKGDVKKLKKIVLKEEKSNKKQINFTCNEIKKEISKFEREYENNKEKLDKLRAYNGSPAMIDYSKYCDLDIVNKTLRNYKKMEDIHSQIGIIKEVIKYADSNYNYAKAELPYSEYHDLNYGLNRVYQMVTDYTGINIGEKIEELKNNIYSSEEAIKTIEDFKQRQMTPSEIDEFCDLLDEQLKNGRCR